MLPAMLALAAIILSNDSDARPTVVMASLLLLATLWTALLRSARTIFQLSVEAQRGAELAKGLENAYSSLLEEIVQRERADEHTATFGRKLDLVIRETPLPTIEWDSALRVAEWNPAAESLFGYARDEVLGRQSVADLIFAEPQREWARELLRQLVSKGEGFHVVSENISRSGGKLTCSWAVTPLLDANGELSGIVAQAVDMTELNSAFRGLEESQRRLEEAQQLAHIGHWQWDFLEHSASFSREALRIFGKSEAWRPTLGDIAGLVIDEMGEGLLERVRQGGCEPKLDFCIEHRLGDRDGRRELRTSVRAEYGARGEPLRFIATTQDVTEMLRVQQQLHSLAFFDPLTGLPNRALICDRIRLALAESSWHRDVAGPLGLMVLDLDDFKAINDSLGHVIGDQLLCEAASRLCACVRSYDTVARLGGDEFAILLPEVREGLDLGGIARKIIDAFSSPFVLAEREYFVTCSIGVVVYPSDGHDADELLRNADSAMYHAKGLGRNNFQFYASELTRRSTERLALDSQLRQAERNGELELYYQPQIDLASGRLIGAEALLRWNHPQHGLVMPDKFIGLAEDTGLIVPIGEWVLRTSCQAVRRWNEGRADGHLRVAVNLSPRQFRGNDLLGVIRRGLEETGCRPEWLECEITENLLLADSEDIHAKLLGIGALGIPLSIDDFGTGYSSLGYLNRYPVGAIKIDRSFVRDITSNRDAAELVKAIISMAHSLRLQLVAEGVETREQEVFLRQHRCHIGQGWLYGKAMPQREFEQLLHSGDAWPAATPCRPVLPTVGEEGGKSRSEDIELA
jgi:diguanylate cyclase (GGDEF)-like protein/PAS domain S-box-containing protein